MSKHKKTRNKAYRPKPVNKLAAFVALDAPYKRATDARPLIATNMTDLRISCWSALDRMSLGKSTSTEWGILAVSMNIAMILAEWNIGAEYLQTIIEAQDGLIRAKERALRHGVWRLDGDALRQITDGLTVHDAQLEIATTEELRRAIAAVQQREETQMQLLEAAA